MEINNWVNSNFLKRGVVNLATLRSLDSEIETDGKSLQS